ncbi:uncharacterized protein F5147DRAFT_813133 [Suillus discolor]|uniref:Uncharacterized protein n=1 Tax=Suillus discolor TaxID=1912936 RepID=A0A9P7F1Z5_9AGAM|nr:uncharacterized protein F5147DRAFT_813133 [Suillus discolor]KAG2100459.1 hypothetical protein F5147DRAFT_813133 [Suillus discolor]
MGEDEWAPFCDEYVPFHVDGLCLTLAAREEWGLAEWLVKSLGQTRTDEFLKLPITRNRMQASFHNNRSFLKKVDELLHGAAWSRKKISIQGNRTDEKGEPLHEDVELWMRNPVECIKDLIGNPLFKDQMVYTPARAYTDSAGLHRVIDDMWTADWWCDMQKKVPEGATIAPIILATDKTSLSQFRGDKTAYPLDCFTPDECSLANYRLFHHCMSLLLQPLAAGEDGVEMVCADALIRRVYPILAAYCLVACCKENRCPKCVVAADERGDPLDSPMRDPAVIKGILEKRKTGHHPAEFEEFGLRTVYAPFWANLPHSNMAFTPDLLHQLHKGIFKDHLVKWCLDIVGEEEMDARFKAMPDYPGLRHFKKGISMVKQWTGTEHKEMQRVFVGLLAGAVPSQVLVVAQALLDFSYYAQLRVHSTESLNGLESTLAIFHANKDVLQQLNIRNHFNIPKLHQLSHYVQSILLFGATDGFNSELPERLHIDFAKEAYRASNKCDYEEQMALWLQRQEAVFLRGSYLNWLLEQSQSAPTNFTHDHGYDSDSDSEMEGPNTTPAYPQRLVQHLVTAHGASMFLPALKLFLRNHMPHAIIAPGLQDRFDVFRQVVITAPPNPLISESPGQWRVRATPEVLPGRGRKPGSPAKFDMALTSNGIQPCTLEGMRVGQVRVIFTLPRQFGTYSRALAYIEWFTPLREPDRSSGLHQLSCSTRRLHRNAAVIHIDEIARPCHLIPRMGQTVDRGWTSANVYESTSDFYLNSFIDLDTFCMSTID